MAGMVNLWHAERSPWHVAFTVVSILFFINFLIIFSDQHLYIVKNMFVHTYWTPWRLFMNYHCYQTFFRSQEWCKVFPGYLLLGY
jgi:hypothetical protein